MLSANCFVAGFEVHFAGANERRNSSKAAGKDKAQQHQQQQQPYRARSWHDDNRR
jgi:hypothetical protein